MFRSAQSAPLLTAADVERISLPGKQVELVRGRLVVREPPGTRHGAIAANLAYHLTLCGAGARPGVCSGHRFQDRHE